MRLRHGNRHRVTMAAIAVALLPGCDDDPTGPQALPLCRDPVTIAVGAGTRPEFRWSPECRVEVLSVESTAEGVPHWIIFAGPFDEGAIQPGVRYGVVPPGALDVTFFPGAPLEAGIDYTVVLAVSGPADESIEVGRQTFRP